MHTAHPYQAFGLNVLSEIAMPLWVQGVPPWDVTVRWGAVPRELPGAARLRDVGWAQGDTCLLNLPALGRLLVESGNRITAEPADGAAPTAMTTLLAGTGMATVLYQRGHLCLHASAVAKDGRALLVTGFSGAGKSTLASALLRAGYDFISDDVCVLRVGTDGSFEIVPSYPSLRLCDDSFTALDLPLELRQPDPVDEKHRIRPEVKTDAGRTVVARICHLETGPVSTPVAEEIRGIERVSLIQRNLFRPRLALLAGDREKLLAMSAGLGAQIDCRRIIRPSSGFPLDELCTLATT